MTTTTHVSCSKCHQHAIPPKGTLHWAKFTVKSSYYAFLDGTIDETIEVDLCPACKKLLNGFLHNNEFEPSYRRLFLERGCDGNVDPNC